MGAAFHRAMDLLALARGLRVTTRVLLERAALEEVELVVDSLVEDKLRRSGLPSVRERIQALKEVRS